MMRACINQGRQKRKINLLNFNDEVVKERETSFIFETKKTRSIESQDNEKELKRNKISHNEPKTRKKSRCKYSTCAGSQIYLLRFYNFYYWTTTYVGEMIVVALKNTTMVSVSSMLMPLGPMQVLPSTLRPRGILIAMQIKVMDKKTN